MASTKRKINKGFIVLNKGERIAVISLLSIIAIFLGFSVFRPMIHLSKKDELAFHRLDSMIAAQEAIQKQQQEQTMSTVVSGDKKEHPSNVLIEHRSETKKRQYPRETHQEETATSHITTEHASQKAPLSTLDINIADSTELIALPQIGVTMASRIHRYRERLGGFVSLDQLYEIKGMDTARFETIKPYIVLNDNDLRKINVNQDEFKVLLRHPYLEYDQVKAIVNHRERKGMIKNWEQLKGIVGEVNPQLEQYIIY